MPAKKFNREKEIQDYLVQLISDGTLTDEIIVPEQISTLINRKNENLIPHFSLDHLLRIKSAEAAEVCLESLYMLETLSVDEDVSSERREVLRPDIVCVNAENESIVLFELKKSKQTGRQALTELLAYEHELKNTLPFLSEFNVIFVLVSSEWSTLMDHAIAGTIMWANKNLLCIDAKKDEESIVLSVRMTNAWKLTGSRYFPEFSLPSVTICLYDYVRDSDRNRGEREFDHRLWTAMELMARAGDRSGEHGFAVLWEDFHPLTETSFNITICGINPFEFYKSMRRDGGLTGIDNVFLSRLDDFVSNNDPSGHHNGLTQLYNSALPLLEEVSSPRMEGFSHWNIDKEELKSRAKPVLCEFWGVLGDYVRNYITHPAVRKHKKGWINNHDWRDPRIGVTLIDELFDSNFFKGGIVRPSDAFNLGILVGREYFLRNSYQSLLEDTNSDHKKKSSTLDSLGCMLVWNFYELGAVLEEVTQLANAADNVKPPATPLSLSDDPSHETNVEIEHLNEWIINEFLQNQLELTELFQLGLKSPYLIDDELSAMTIHDKENEIELCRQYSNYLQILFYQVSIAELDGLRDAVESQRDVVLNELNLTSAEAVGNLDLGLESLLAAWPSILMLSDSFFPAAFHSSDEGPVFDNVDWEWLKEGIMELHQRGLKYPAVMIENNGSLVTTALDDIPEMSVFPPISDPEQEVYFMDQRSFIAIAQRLTWNELKSQEQFIGA